MGQNNNQDIIVFDKGINLDVHPQNQPKGSYRDAVNIEEDTFLGSRSKEKGFKDSNIVNYPDDTYILIGHCTLNNIIITFHTNDLGSDKIGYIDGKTYVNKITEDLGFNSSYQIDCTARNLYNDNRIVYFTDYYNPPRQFNLDFTYTGDIISQLALFQNTNLPYVKSVQVQEGGSVKTGIVQFAVRYLSNDSLNTSTFGVVSNGVLIEGRPDDVSDKYVTLTLAGLDTSYNQVEIAAIRYEEDLTPIVEIFTRFNTSLVRNGEFTVSYTGEEEIIATTVLDELNQVPVIYNKAKNIIAKDSRLFLSNLETSELSDDFKQVAKDIRLKYTVKEVDRAFYTNHKAAQDEALGRGEIEVQGTDQTYSDPVFSFSNKGYMRDEAYSFGVAFVINGYITPVYHIPGYIPVDAFNERDFTSIQAESVTGYANPQCRVITTISNAFKFKDTTTCYVSFNSGSYIDRSYRVLEVGQNYIVIELDFNGTATGKIHHSQVETLEKYLAPYFSLELHTDEFYDTNNIVHHKFPTLAQEPHFGVRQSGILPVPIIRIMGIEVEMPTNSIAWNNIKDSISGYIIVREPRDTNNKKSIMSQGLLVNSLQMDNKAIGDNNWNNFDFYSVAPFLGKTNIRNDNHFFNNNPITKFGISHTTVERFFQDGSPDGSDRRSLYDVGGTADISHIQTPAEESNDIRRLDLQFFFSPEGIMLGQDIIGDYATNELRLLAQDTLLMSGLGYTNSLGLNLTGINSGAFSGTAATKGPYIGFSDFIGLAPLTEDEKQKINIKSIFKVAPNLGGVKETGNTTVALADSMNPNYPIFNMMSKPTVGVRFEEDFKESLYNKIYTISKLELINNPYTDDKSQSKDLINIRNRNSVQYGRLDNAYYVPCFYQTDTTANNFEVFGGDIYITKYAFSNYLNLRATYFNGVDEDNRLTSPRINSAGDYELDEGIETRHLAYFFVESKVNSDFRHRPYDFDNNVGGVDFFPNNTVLSDLYDSAVVSNIKATPDRLLGLLDVHPEFGNHVGYDLRYSIDNDAVQYIADTVEVDQVSNFHNRTIYSDVSIEGEGNDSYRNFLPLNYQDIPKETGPINDTFVNSNIMYHRTDRGIWRTFINEREALVSNISDVYVGNGGIFGLPAKQVSDYGGLSKWGSLQTPFGYFYIDEINKKVIKFSDKIEHLSDNGMFSFFRDLNYDYIIDEHYQNRAFVDNPINMIGYNFGYDPDGKYLLLTSHQHDFTLSWSLMGSYWLSRHTYKPQTYLSLNNKFYCIVDNEVYIKDKDKLFSFGNPYTSSITFISNPDPYYTKTFDNLILQASSSPSRVRYSTNGILQNQDSDYVTLSSYNANYKTGNFRFINRNIQFPVFRNSNDKSRMKNNYLETHLEWTNNFDLNLIGVTYRLNAR